MTRAEAPYDRLLALFDVAADWFEANNFYGCMFINAIGEYSATNTAIRQVCKEFKALVGAYIEGLCAELHVLDPAGLAEELGLLFEGAIVTAQVSQQKRRAAQTAKTAAAALIDKALAEHGDTSRG